MLTRTYTTLVLTGATLAIGQPVLADNPPTVEQLQKQMAEMQAQMDDLRHRLGEDWMTERRAEEIRDLVQDVLADADTRFSLLQNGMTAGYDGGFVIGSSDGRFKLTVNGQLQFRFVYNSQDDSSGDSDRWGFENRRTKLKFKGHTFDPTWKYTINGAFDRDDGGVFFVEDAIIHKDMGNGWEIRFGQFKPPFMREELTSSSRQQLVERSLVNEEFNQDRAQGVELAYEGDTFRFMAMYHDGFGTDNTSFNMEDTEFAITARIEALLSGSWSQFKDFEGWPGGESGVLVGAAVHYEKEEFGTSAGPEVEDLRFTGDIGIEFNGASIFGAIVYQSLDDDASFDVERWGAVVQGGYFVTDSVEVFVRYENGDFDSVSVEDLSVISLGFNKFWEKHKVKWTMDVGIGLEEVSSPWATSGAGYRADAPGDDGQIVLRSQFQLVF